MKSKFATNWPSSPVESSSAPGVVSVTAVVEVVAGASVVVGVAVVVTSAEVADATDVDVSVVGASVAGTAEVVAGPVVAGARVVVGAALVVVSEAAPGESSSAPQATAIKAANATAAVIL